MSRKTARRAGVDTAPVVRVSGTERSDSARLRGMESQQTTLVASPKVNKPDIERWRLLSGLTIREVAQLLDINLATWHRWIKGESRPGRKYRMRLDCWLERQDAVIKGKRPPKS